MMEERALIVFAKLPRAGQVKTRLGMAIGMEEAVKVYEEFARHAFSLAESLASDGVKVYLFYVPDASEEQIRSWVGCDFVFAPQLGETLGERMRNAFDLVFRDGASSAVIIGTDVPELDAGIVARAFRTLDSHELVVGPSPDGGYYLLGMKPPVKDVFDGIVWSTEMVLRQTRERAEALRLSISTLEELMDVDTREDYRRYLERSRSVRQP